MEPETSDEQWVEDLLKVVRVECVVDLCLMRTLALNP